MEAKAALALDGLWARLGGKEQFAGVDVRLLRTDQTDPPTREAAFARLRVEVRDRDPEVVGRAFSNAAVELALASYPGFATTAPPGAAAPLITYVPATTAQRTSVVSLGNDRWDVAPTTGDVGAAVASPPPAAGPWRGHGATVRAPFGRLVGARSGDKGGDANLGVWVRTDRAYRWLEDWLTVPRLRELVPEAAGITVTRHPLPNLRAINFVLEGYLDDGVASSVQMDPQAKALGEYLRARLVEIPEELLVV